ncbi:MAG: hypothetical protein ACRDJU_09105 [Actinomycetota bacterium]
MDLASSEPTPREAPGASAGRYRTARSLAVAVAGLFAGHWLVYRILAPNALQRALLLAETGHAYLPPAVTAGAGLAAVAAVATFCLGFRRGASSHRHRRQASGERAQHHTVVGAVVLPAIAQAVAFCLLEALERILAGAPLNGLLGPLIPVGVGLQLAVGALGGLLLFGLDRAGEQAGRHRSHREPVLRRARPSVASIASAVPKPRPSLAEPFGNRGPPEPAPTIA